MCPSAEEAASSAPAIEEDRLRLLFALLFSSPESVTLDRIRQVLYPAVAQDSAATEGSVEQPAEEHFSPRDHLDALEQWMAERQLPLSLHQVGRSWRLLTVEDLAEELVSVRKAATKEKLGPASLEVLALVAYRQPVLKADIDAIRGVKSGSHLRHLLDLRLVKILGRAELPGRPFLYGTTKEFLDRFGLRDLEDLPEAGRLASPAEQGVAIQDEAKPSAEIAAGDSGENAAEVATEAQESTSAAASEPDSEPQALAANEPEPPAAESSTGK